MSHLLWYPGHEFLLPDIVEARNCTLRDAAGRTWVDLESGVWCTSIGHAHPRIARILADQPAAVAHTGFCWSSRTTEEAAREILSLLGMPDGRCVFLCSGSEAVEYGVRVARMLGGPPLFLALADAYFGAYGAASQREAGGWFNFDWTGCAQCPEASTCSDACPQWAAIPKTRIGGFLFEPGSSSGLVRFPPVKLIQNLARLVRENGGILLVNEVTTGVGRTGVWFGHEHYGLSPDIVALGKGMGNGYPVAVAAFSAAVVERLGDQPVRYAQSHQNDPLGAAIAREVIAVIREDGLIERGRALGERLRDGLERVRDRTGRIREIRARGLMAAVELEDDPGAPRTIRVHRELVARGFIVGRRPGVSVLRLDPALTIEADDLDRFLEVFAELLAQTEE